MKLKREKFERAIAKSDSKSHTLLDSATYVPEDADEGLVLQETLARANRSAQRNRQLEKQVHDQTVQSKLPTAKISAAVITESDNDGIIFSAASDFMINVRANAQEARQPTAVKAEVIVPTVEPAEEVTESSDEDAMDIDGIDRGPQASVKQEESSEPSDEEDLTFMKDVSSVDGGISGALRLIRSRGLANPKALHPLVGGRSRDGRSEEYKDPLPHVRLDRVDEFGRSMTQKAAFRELSYRFHGHRPGAKKREKVLKELGQQLKRQEAISGKAVSSTQRLKDATSKTGRHYVVMDSKSGAYGGVTTQKLSIDVAEPESVDVGEEESRAYVHGSKKVEFALNKAE
uniref:Uncharacterized protein n=1 Tax=Spongospora subterranea TaxID=70186 RepID=A0A0H5QHG1_9EUKA|eukprot:CRZ01408.1 hypothetical protein [Spongospora subterranea]